MSLEQPVRGTIRTGYTAHMIRILIADDHAIVRAGLKQFIAEEQDMTVAGEATTGAEAVAFVRSSECDVVLLDIAMPDINGVDTLRQLKQIKPTLLVDDLGGDPNQPPHASLSEREFQIFCKLAAGKPVSKIADELFLSVKTVSTYRARILQKMDMKTNADL